MKSKKINFIVVPIILIFIFIIGKLWAATINVPTDYSTIQAAINAASTGDIINVAANTYVENLLIDATKDNLTIQGADKATTIIQVNAANGVSIYATGVKFDGFTVIQIAAATVQKALYLFNSATGCTISNCIFNGTGSTKSGSMGVLVRDNNNTFDNIESFGWTGYGIDVYGGSATGPFANNVLIKNSNCHDNGSFNIAIDRSTNVTIENCISGGGGTGIVYFETAAGPVTGGLIKGCTIYNAIYDGIRLVGSDINVENNELYGCSTTTDPSYPPSAYAAIRITTNKWPNYAANKDTVIKNNVHDNLGHSVLLDYGTYPEPKENFFGCNDFFNNAYNFDASTLTSTVPAEHCWWGHTSGPGGAGPGSGDAVSINVDFDPWLATPWEQDNKCNPPTAITLATFSAKVENNVVTISWTTETEVNNLGFNIHRSQQENGGYFKINESLIVGEGDAFTGATYSYIDRPNEADTYYYKLEDVSVDGQTTFHGPVKVTGVTSVQAAHSVIPTDYQLSQNYPNPFNPETHIQYAIPKDGLVAITIYDVRGQIVCMIVNERKAAGTYSVSWDSRDDRDHKLSSGVYFYRIQAGEFAMTRKMILMK